MKMVLQQITQDAFFQQGTKANTYWAIRQYDKCTSGKDNCPAVAWDNKFIIDWNTAFELKGDLKRGTTSGTGYAEQSWDSIMQGKTPWGAAANVSSCEVVRPATTSTFSTSPGYLYFPKQADKHWYLTATMAWFTDLKPTTSTVRARGLIDLWFKHKTLNQYLVMDLAMINLKKGTGTDWIGETFSVGSSYSSPAVSNIGTTKVAHWNVVITSNPPSGSWKSTGTALDIDSYVTSAMSNNWHSLDTGWTNDSNRANWELWDAELGVEIDDDSHNTAGQIGQCRMATKAFEVLYQV
jgi:hypothetical protein